MSETLYMRISTQNISCSQCQMNTCHTSFSYIQRERERDRERERGGEEERLAKKGRERQTQQKRQADTAKETGNDNQTPRAP